MGHSLKASKSRALIIKLSHLKLGVKDKSKVSLNSLLKVKIRISSLSLNHLSSLHLKIHTSQMKKVTKKKKSNKIKT